MEYAPERVMHITAKYTRSSTKRLDSSSDGRLHRAAGHT